MKKNNFSIFSFALLSLLSVGALASCGDNTPADTGATTSSLQSIAVTKNPTKMDYAVGQDFDPAGMEVTASYSDKPSQVVTDYRLTGDKNLQLGARVTVMYVEGIRKTTQLKVNVVAKNIVNYEFVAPTVNEYITGESFVAEGFKVVAVYDDGSKSPISDYEILTEIVPEDGKIQVKIGDEITKTYQTTVKKGVTVASLDVTGFAAEYLPGVDLTKEKITVTAHYSDDTSRVITKGYTLDKTKTAEGDTGVTVTYLQASKQVLYKIIKDERIEYFIEAESAVITSSKDMRTSASGAGFNTVNIGNNITGTNGGFPRSAYTGYGFLHNFASNTYKLSYKFNSSSASPAVFSFMANGKGTMDKMFKSATLNGTKFDVVKSTIGGGSGFALAQLGNANITKGLNELVLECAGSSCNLDSLVIKSASVITTVCAEQHAKAIWQVLTAPTATEGGKIYKLCPVCKAYEEVSVPAIGGAGLTKGTPVAATATMAAYTPYTYVKDQVTYNFNVMEGNATGALNKQYFDFCSVEVETGLYERYMGAMYLNDEGKANITNGLPTQYKDNATDTKNNNAIGPQSNAQENGTGTFKISFTSDKEATANIILRVASHKKITFHLNDCTLLTVNDASFMVGKDTITSNGVSFFQFEERLLAKVNLVAGKNTIEFKTTSKFPNLDGLYVETAAAITL